MPPSGSTAPCHDFLFSDREFFIQTLSLIAVASSPLARGIVRCRCIGTFQDCRCHVVTPSHNGASPLSSSSHPASMPQAHSAQWSGPQGLHQYFDSTACHQH